MAENGVEDVEQEKQSLERDVYSKVQKSRNKDCTGLREKLDCSEKEKEKLREELERLKQEIEEMKAHEAETLQEKDKELTQVLQRIQEMKTEETEQIKARDTELAYYQQLLKEKDEQLQSMQSGLCSAASDEMTQSASSLYDDALSPHSRIILGKLSRLVCRCRDPAPQAISRGSAATDHNFAYFAPAGSTSIYRYTWNTEKWKLLPISLLYRNSALVVVVDSGLTTVGGTDSRYSRANTLHTLQHHKWVQKFPPMKRRRSCPAAVCTPSGHCIVVAGGLGICGVRSRSVELLQLSTMSWYELTELPKPLPRPSATFCGDKFYIVDDVEGFSCSLRDTGFLQKPITAPPHSLSWDTLPTLPAKDPMCATLCGQLVIVGGFNVFFELVENQNPAVDNGFLRMPSCFQPSSTINQLVDGQWVVVGSMSRARRDCLVVTPLPDKMLIVGGWKENMVEECLVV